MTRNFEEFRKLIDEHPAALIVLATYTREEFEELRPGEDYAEFKRTERVFMEEVAAAGYQDRFVFQEIDSVGYYRWLADNHLPNIESSRAWYVAQIYQKKNL